MNNELISIVIPVYNVEKYLKECLNSVVKQTYKSIEIILVNDGSTDNSLSICEEYSKIDNRIKIINKKNGGLSDARNVGIDIAKGKYITFIDSDDFIENDYVEYLYNILMVEKTDLSCCQKTYIDDNGNLLNKKDNFNMQNVCGKKNCMRAFFSDVGLDTFAWGKLYLTEMFNNVRYPYGKLYEDVFTTHKIIDKCNSIVIGNECKYFYRNRNTSITGANFSLRQLDRIEAHKERTSFIKEKYPELVDLSSSGIVYATNQCVLKIAFTENYNLSKYLKLYKSFQNYYRHYEKAFLNSGSGIMAKLFSLLAYVSIPITVRILRIILHLKII